MPPSRDDQAGFVAALRAPHAPPPAGVRGRGSELPARRFGIYRNNVHASLCTALAHTFPVTERLVGKDFFRAMARTFVARELPRTPVLLEYGETLPAFIDGFEPAAGLPYLGDVARLEWAAHEAYHAAEAEPLAREALAAIPAEHVPVITLALHPSLAVVRSAWPVLDILEAQADGAGGRVDAGAGGQDVLVVRPGAEVELRHLPPGAADFIEILRAGRPLGEAAATVAACAPAFDLAANLQGLLESGALVAWHVPETGVHGS
jgi:hypothetical protein